MKQLHRLTGILTALFAVAHLLNHTTAWFGIETHQQVLAAFRRLYRVPIIEVVLIGSFLFQIVSGLRLSYALWKNPTKTTFENIQLASGMLFALFLLQHISATLGQRLLLGVDTNFYFAAAVVLEKPLLYYFIPYYFVGIVAFGVHVANVHQKKIASFVGNQSAQIHFYTIIAIFTLIALLILYVFTGNHFEISLPAEYRIFS
ncbi:MAG: DUF4405 domain-containing protein [Bacteroidota bacterium]